MLIKTNPMRKFEIYQTIYKHNKSIKRQDSPDRVMQQNNVEATRLQAAVT